ncbi:DUF1330 domain-containing protein [Qipengyuania sp. ASV99]|uniref:DUF1330 domain-containing protein n=1 Tax=Qipengyuania sp. ASV99 TaxID=3399681 RepID=UPI003A4C67A4
MFGKSCRAILGLAVCLGIVSCSEAPDSPDALQDQANRPAYLIAEVEVTNPDEYPAYMEAAAPLIAEYGGRYIVRAGENEVPEGRPIEGRLVVIEFPDHARLLEFWNSAEYQAIKPLRTDNANSRIILADGIAP